MSQTHTTKGEETNFTDFYNPSVQIPDILAWAQTKQRHSKIPNHFDQYINSKHFTNILDRLSTDDNTTTSFEFRVSATEEDLLINEPLEDMPRKTRRIKLMLTYKGRGEPILQSDTELIIFDDDA